MQQILKTLFEATPTLTPKLKECRQDDTGQPEPGGHHLDASACQSRRVTPPTMIRLATTLGFENYESFRRVFQSSINKQNFEDRANWLQLTSASDGVTPIVQGNSGVRSRQI